MIAGVGPGLECIQSIKGSHHQVPDLLLHLGDPGVLSLIKGVPLLNHGLEDQVHSVGELAMQEPDVRLHQEVEVVGVSAIVMTDGGH